MDNTISDKPLVNRVANSGLITINLENMLPEGELVSFDLKGFLFMEMILKEKEFRQALKEYDWSQYAGKNLAVFCSTDAIIPMWAYMLVSSYATPFVKDIVQAHPDHAVEAFIQKNIAQLDLTPYVDQRLVIKGCGDKPVPPSAYLSITHRLQPIAKSILFGEPCSTVPVYKKPK